jgi:hypothetical protein
MKKGDDIGGAGRKQVPHFVQNDNWMFRMTKSMCGMTRIGRLFRE